MRLMTCISPNGSLQVNIATGMKKGKKHTGAFELVLQQMNGMTIDEAESVGVEILAQVTAKRVYVEDKGAFYLESLFGRVCDRAEEYARSHASEIAMSKVLSDAN